MTNRKSTKRALLGSVVAMVLCLAMLVGATFAWFTDTASTGVNKIQAGNLDVKLMYSTDMQTWKEATDQTKLCLLYTSIFFVIVAAALLALTAMSFGDRSPRERLLKITIPENLDYDGLFDDIFRQYTSSHTLERVKTTNMGTLYELQYRITLKEAQVPKAFLDALRCRNGNLNILCSREMQKETL